MESPIFHHGVLKGAWWILESGGQDGKFTFPFSPLVLKKSVRNVFIQFRAL